MQARGTPEGIREASLPLGEGQSQPGEHWRPGFIPAPVRTASGLRRSRQEWSEPLGARTLPPSSWPEASLRRLGTCGGGGEEGRQWEKIRQRKTTIKPAACL